MAEIELLSLKKPKSFQNDNQKQFERQPIFFQMVINFFQLLDQWWKSIHIN
jgi:hypothetical protein